MVKFSTYLTLIAALILSGVAAYFSVLGMMEIFSSAAQEIGFMVIVLEATKVITAYWGHLNWDKMPALIRGYLTTAVIILMGITSLGIYGFLSKAHIAQEVEISTTYGGQTGKLDAQIATLKLREKQVDRQLKIIEDVISAAADKGYVSKSLQLNKQYGPEQKALYAEKTELQNQALVLEQQKVEVGSNRKLSESKMGPLKYVVGLFYGNDATQAQFDNAVRLLIVVIVMVFDPLAIMLLIGTGYVIRSFPVRIKDEEEPPPVRRVLVRRPKNGPEGDGQTVLEQP